MNAAQNAADLSRLFEEAWNAHDMKAFANLFEGDATFVSRFGHLWRGRDEIVARHAGVHATIYRDCRISNRLLALDAVSDDVAMGSVQSLVSVGRFMPLGPRKFACLFTYVARRGDGGWRIRAGSNVAFTDLETGALRIDSPGMSVGSAVDSGFR